jgi:cytochrome P450
MVLCCRYSCIPQVPNSWPSPLFCVGSHLGCAEGMTMLREILTRLPDIQQAGPESWATTSLTSGLDKLPVRFTPTN